MPKRALTAAAVDRLKPPKSGQVEHFDTGFPGLALRVSYGGGRSWVYFFRADGRQRRLTLGVYPAMSLAEAREAWRTARAAVDRGDDPAAAKAEAKRREPDTVRSVGELFITRYAKPRNRTADEVARMFELHLYPALGKRRIETVTRRDILDLLDAVETKASAARANRVLANVRRLFSWAMERGIIEASPVANVKAPGQERSRDRVLSEDELRAFLRACERLGEPFGPLFRLLLLTGQRRDEVASAPWAEFNLPGAIWRVPAARTKNKRATEAVVRASGGATRGAYSPLTARRPCAGLAGWTRRAAAVVRLRSGEGTAGRPHDRGVAQSRRGARGRPRQGNAAGLALA